MRSHLYTRSLHRGACLLLVLLLSASASLAQEGPPPFAGGLNGPLGMTFDDEGNLYVAEQGTGNGDARIVVVTPDGQVHPFLVGLPSELGPEGANGTNSIVFDSQGRALVLQGEGTDALSMSLLILDPTGFSPGDAPFTLDDADIFDIGTFSLGLGISPNSNPYRIAEGPDGDLFIVDSGANALLRRDADTGALRLFARFAPVPNPLPFGPPVAEAVPTGIVFTGDHFLVSTLTGFPFAPGLAGVYEVDLDGRVSLLQDGLTSLSDLTVDPVDGRPVAVQIADFTFDPPPPGFRPGTGKLTKILKGRTVTIADGLNLSSSATFDAEGNLYTSSLFGLVFKMAPTPGLSISRLFSRLETLLETTPASRQVALLRARLLAVLDSHEAGDADATIRALRSFTSLARNLQRQGSGRAFGINNYNPNKPVFAIPTGRLDTDLVQSLIDEANAIIAALDADGQAASKSAAQAQEVPAGFALSENYPNPFSTSTQFSLRVDEPQHVTVTVFNAVGQRVAVLFEGHLDAGANRSLTFEAGNLPGGLYLIRAQGNTFSTTRKVTLVR